MRNPKSQASSKTRTVALVSLGCPKNTVDSEVMLGRLAGDGGYRLVTDPSNAEIVVVNTCGFIEAAKQESIDAILKASRYKESGKLETLVVAGCLAQRYGEDLKKELPEIDVLLGLNDVGRLNNALGGTRPDSAPDLKAPLLPGSLPEATYVYDASAPRLLSTPAHYAYVKISEGCDLPCTFCVIPKIRGHFRSRSIDDIEREAVGLAARGVKELCLVAQDSTWYGSDIYGKPRLAELLVRLREVRDIEWVRVHYMYPSRVTDAVLEAMDHPKIAPYFDVPLQHASDRILRSMKRIGSRKDLESLLKRIRAKFPKASLRSTFIVGYPGETDGDFAELLDFLKGARLDYAGFFPFSGEEGTSAFALSDRVPEDKIKGRLAESYRVQEAMASDAHSKWVGERLRVVVEGSGEKGTWIARSVYQAPEVDGVILVEGAGRMKTGGWMEVEVTHVLGHDLVARPVKVPV